MSLTEDFRGLDILEPDFVFDAVTGHKRIINHCLSHILKGEALRKNGVGTPTALEVFGPLFQPLLREKGRCSAIVTGDDALYLDYIGLLANIVTDGSAISRYYFLGFRARRLQSNLFLKTIFRMNNKPKRDKKSKKLDDEQEEIQVYKLVCKELAIELSKNGKDIEDCRKESRDSFTDTTKPSKRSKLYVEEATGLLFKNRVYLESTLTLGTMWLFDDFEEEQSAGIGALLEVSLSTNLKNLLQMIP